MTTENIEKHTFWNVFMQSGTLGVTLIVIALIFMAAGILFLCGPKQKDKLGHLLISASLNFSLISAGLCFLHSVVKIGNIMSSLGILSIEMQFGHFIDACIGPMFLFVVALFAFLLKLFFQIKIETANQQVDPIVTTPADKVDAQSTQGHP